MTAENNEQNQTSIKEKFGGKDIKVYVLCGVIATWVLAEAFMSLIGALFGLAFNLPLTFMASALLTGIIGQNGVSLLGDYTTFVGAMIGLLLILFLVKPWRPYLKAFGTKPAGNKPHMLLIGLLVGFAMNGLCILAAVLAGSVQLQFVQFNIIGFLVFLVFICIQSSLEEFVCRGFAYQRLKRTYNTAVAIIASAAMFSLGHIFNPGISALALIDIFATGVLYALMVRYFDSIWLAAGVHTGWNFTQNIIFGLPNSGLPSTYSFFGIVGNTSNGFAYDTAFGVEGTYFAIAVNLICALAVWLWGRKYGKKQDFNIWKGSPLEASQAAALAAATPVASGEIAANEASATPVNDGAKQQTTANSNAAVAAPKPRWFY